MGEINKMVNKNEISIAHNIYYDKIYSKLLKFKIHNNNTLENYKNNNKVFTQVLK